MNSRIKLSRPTRRTINAALVPALGALALGLLGGVPASAETYPTKPIKLVVPFVAGSPVDALARVVAQHLSTRLGQTMIVENQSGAGSTLGARVVAKAAPDGYTLLFAINSHVYGLYPNPGYDPIKSFATVAPVAQWSHVLVVRPDFPAKTVQELIDYARANPGKVTFGYGLGTPPQILGEMLKIATHADIASIPYRGGAQAITDMLGGRIDMNFGSTSTLLPMIQQGTLRAIAYTGVKRHPDLPDVPTIVEAGFPQIAFNPDAWAGILAPAGTPKDIVDRLNREITAALNTAELHDSLAKLGYQPRIASPQEFATFLVAEMQKWPPIVTAAGMKAQ